MGRYVDVDHFGESDMDSVVFAIDWVVGVALSEASNDKRKVAAKSASLRCND